MLSKLLQRWVLLFFIVSYFPYGLDYYIPLLAPIFKPYFALVDSASIGLVHALGLAKGKVIVQDTGSGDALLSYVFRFFFLCVSFPLAACWVLSRPHASASQALYNCGFFILRFTLGAILLSYGFGKLIPIQFASPSLYSLMQPLVLHSPMGLVWVFMGFSPAYTMFTGLAVVVAGICLFFNRTALVGAMLSLAVMVNVFMLNMCYDVPVKLSSFEYMVMSIALIMMHRKGLFTFLFSINPASQNALMHPTVSKPQSIFGHSATVML